VRAPVVRRRVRRVRNRGEPCDTSRAARRRRRVLGIAGGARHVFGGTTTFSDAGEYEHKGIEWIVATVPRRGVLGAGQARTLSDRQRVDLWGRLSNPVQRRLPTSEIDTLIDLYREGASIDALARRYQVHRTTVIHHLDEAGIARRRVVRKMTDESVACAAARYEQGASLALVATEFGVHQRTVARELLRAGTSIRPRRGWRR
jgi:transposase-like protein